MLQAQVRSGGSAVHVLGEADPYDLEMLGTFARQSMHDPSPLYVKVNIDASDRLVFAQHSGWLQGLAASGAVIEVVMSSR